MLLRSIPPTSDSALLPAAARAGGEFTFTYRRERPELQYLVQTATDLVLADWTAAGVDQSTPAPIVTASTPAIGVKRYLRLQITLP